MLLQKAFERMKDDLFQSDYKSHVTQVYTPLSEVKFADKLNILVEKYPQVTFGSYPKWTHNYYSTKVTIEAESLDLVNQVAQEFKNTVPTIDYDPDPFVNPMEKIQDFLSQNKDEKFIANYQSALQTLEKCFTDYKPNEVSVAFNGGKDNVAMVHLTMVSPYALFNSNDH